MFHDITYTYVKCKCFLFGAIAFQEKVERGSQKHNLYNSIGLTILLANVANGENYRKDKQI